MASIHARLEKIKDDPSALIDPTVVERACRAAGHRWRRRVLDPVRTLRVFAAQVAHGNTAISHAVRLCGGGFSESAYCQARARLPVAVVRGVFEEFTARARGCVESADGLWRGHRAVLIDGTGIVTPDTPLLRGLLGMPCGTVNGCGLPGLSVLAIFDWHHGLLLDLHAASARTQDQKHAHDLHPALREGDVLVGDRGLCSYVHLALLVQAGMHGVFRMSGSRGMPFPARSGERERRAYNRHRRPQPVLVQLIDEDDQVVEIVKPHNRPGHLSPQRFAAVPGKMVVRAVRYAVQEPGMRTRRITLLTDLTDAVAYPAAALAQLYLARWRIEVNLRHLKQTLGMDRLKCGSIEGVMREMLMHALVYNAVCAARARSAAARGVPPGRVSFIDTLRRLLMGHRPRGAKPSAEPKLWPLRPPRLQPRAVKRTASRFPIMRRPRRQIITYLLERRSAAN